MTRTSCRRKGRETSDDTGCTVLQSGTDAWLDSSRVLGRGGEVGVDVERGKE